VKKYDAVKSGNRPNNRPKRPIPRKPAPRTAFKSGQSGNPAGRPKLTPEAIELRELARANTKQAIGALVEVMNDKGCSPSARVSAASEVLDRGWGRPAQTIAHTGEDGGPVDMNWTVTLVKPK